MKTMKKDFRILLSTFLAVVLLYFAFAAMGDSFTITNRLVTVSSW